MSASIEPASRSTMITQARVIAAFEGGAVYTAERNGMYVVIIDESAAMDVLDSSNREGLQAINELEFTSGELRDAFLRQRRWLVA